jgi:metallophosphoesterase (TIGR00282 family)
MKILCIGDIFGKTGRNAVKQVLPNIKQEKNIDIVLANGDNACHGKCIRKKERDELFAFGVDVITLGNHAFDTDVFIGTERIIRPANYPKEVLGKGYTVYKEVLIINLIGRSFMHEGYDSPFQEIENILENHKNSSFKAIIVDFHAETTSEKYACMHFVKDRVTALFGTHTHVQTADDHINQYGSGYISDIGMTGPTSSVLGVDKDQAIKQFLTAQNHIFFPAKTPFVFQGVLFTIENQKCIDIERIQIFETGTKIL